MPVLQRRRVGAPNLGVLHSGAEGHLGAAPLGEGGRAVLGLCTKEYGRAMHLWWAMESGLGCQCNTSRLFRLLLSHPVAFVAGRCWALLSRPEQTRATVHSCAHINGARGNLTCCLEAVGMEVTAVGLLRVLEAPLEPVVGRCTANTNLWLA